MCTLDVADLPRLGAHVRTAGPASPVVSRRVKQARWSRVAPKSRDGEVAAALEVLRDELGTELHLRQRPAGPKRPGSGASRRAG